VGRISGWRSLLGYQEIEIANVVRWTGNGDGITVDDLQRWRSDHYRGDEWIDQPLKMTNPRGGYPSLAEIAARTLASEDDVRGALQYAVGPGLLRVDGQLDGQFFLVPIVRGRAG
jgi:hypothetical protein